MFAHPPQHRRRLPLIAVVVVLVAAACGGSDPTERGAPVAGALGAAVADEQSFAVATSGDYVADLGFRPDPDGFGFENYGNDPDARNLTAAEMVELFGDDVCAVGSGPTCRLSSAAAIWLHQINGLMAAGHCEGMAALSLVFFAGHDTPEAYGAATTYGLDLDGNEALQRAIARWWATQVVAPANEARLTDGSPNEVLETLSDAMDADEPAELYSILFFQPGFVGGHAVTPYAIEERGDGVMWILVYDNNHPGITRAIEVDTGADTWEYVGSTQPGEPTSAYRGDATTNTLWLSPLSARLGPQRCPVCGGELDDAIAAAGVDELKLTGDGSELAETDFFVRGPAGGRFGRLGGSFVEEIDGAEQIPVLAGARGAPAPVLRVPHVFDLEAVAAGPEGVTTDLTMSYLGAAYDVLVSGIDTASGPARAGFDVAGGEVSFRSGNSTGVTILVALEGDEFHYELEVTVEELDDPSATVELLSPGDDARVGISAGSGGSYSLTLTRFGEGMGDDDRRTLGDVRLEEGEELLLSLDDWVGADPMVLDVLGPSGDPDEPLRSLTVG
jgi:hypothetical protein